MRQKITVSENNRGKRFPHTWRTLIISACLLFGATFASAEVTLRIGDLAATDAAGESAVLAEPSIEDPKLAVVGDECLEVWTCAPDRWVRADFLLWWTGGSDVPPLVTTSPSGTLQNDAGIIGVDGTETLFGGNQIGDESRLGWRLAAGKWLDDGHCTGVEFNYFSVFDSNSGSLFSAGTTGEFGSGDPILARPFYDVVRQGENALLTSFPNLYDGSLTVSGSSEIHSLGVLLRRHLRSGPLGRIDLLSGYRFLRFWDSLRVDERLLSTAATGGIEQNTMFHIVDDFDARNDFHGGELGLTTTLQRGCWDVEFLTKFAVGRVYRTVTTEGSTTSHTPPPDSSMSSAVGGMFALPTNIGVSKTSDVAIMPEFGINLAYAWRQHVRLTAGYTLILLNDVARASEQIDRNVNPSYLPGNQPSGVQRPAVRNATSDLWIQGFNFGVVAEF